jgi:hypothetical protein
MSIRRIAKSAVLGLVLLVVGIAGAQETSQILLELHWDRESGTSNAVVKNTLGDVLAETPWDGALPRTYAADEDRREVPTFIFGALREQLAQSSHLDADDAWTFVRDLMGEQADTPVSQLSTTQQTWISYSGVHVEETCGTWVDSNNECTQPNTSQLSTTFCTESACKVTTIKPEQPSDDE